MLAPASLEAARLVLRSLALSERHPPPTQDTHETKLEYEFADEPGPISESGAGG
jgi:hypothetical protein